MIPGHDVRHTSHEVEYGAISRVCHVTGVEDDADQLQERYHVFNPYLQRLFIYSRPPQLAATSEGIIHSVWNMRNCRVAAGDEAAAAIAFAKSKMAAGMCL